jgi:hypothetical protein
MNNKHEADPRWTTSAPETGPPASGRTHVCASAREFKSIAGPTITGDVRHDE